MKMSCIVCGEFIWFENGVFYNDSEEWINERCKIYRCPGCGEKIFIDDLIPEEE